MCKRLSVFKHNQQYFWLYFVTIDVRSLDSVVYLTCIICTCYLHSCQQVALGAVCCSEHSKSIVCTWSTHSWLRVCSSHTDVQVRGHAEKSEGQKSTTAASVKVTFLRTLTVISRSWPHQSSASVFLLYCEYMKYLPLSISVRVRT